MKNRLQLLAAAILLVTASGAAFGQSAIVRGEASAGVYENIKSTSQALNVAVVSGGGSASAVAHTDTAISILVTSTTVIAANATRKYLAIQNQDAANPIWINCAGSAAVTNGTAVKLLAGQYYNPTPPPSGACAGIATGGTVVTAVVEGN